MKRTESNKCITKKGRGIKLIASLISFVLIFSLSCGMIVFAGENVSDTQNSDVQNDGIQNRLKYEPEKADQGIAERAGDDEKDTEQNNIETQYNEAGEISESLDEDVTSGSGDQTDMDSSETQAENRGESTDASAASEEALNTGESSAERAESTEAALDKDEETSADKSDESDKADETEEQAASGTQGLLDSTVKIGYVNAGYLNVRKGAGTSYTSIGNVSYIYVIIKGSKKDSNGDLWYQISYGSTTGYVYGSYVTNIKDVSINTSKFAAFPDSYQEPLALISAVYPNITFEADEINYTLDEVVTAHVGSKTDNGNIASYDTIYTYMDPMHYLNTMNIFPFVKHTYNSSQNAAGLKNLFSINTSNFLNTTENINALLSAGKNTGVSPYVLAATILIEKGWDAGEVNPDVYGRQVWTGTVTKNSLNVRSGAGSSYSKLSTVSKGKIYIIGSENDSSGTKWYKMLYNNEYIGFVSSKYVTDVKKYNKYYNLFSINQYDSNPVGGGLYYSMKAGWITLAKSLIGGAEFYKDGYISNGQNTYYYKDFNVINPKSNWWHEYASGITDVQASSSNLGLAYQDNFNAKLVLRIPVYKQLDQKGDIDNNGSISAVDFVMIMNHIMGVKKITGSGALNRADYDGDGKITSADYIAVKKKIMAQKY